MTSQTLSKNCLLNDKLYADSKNSLAKPTVLCLSEMISQQIFGIGNSIFKAASAKHCLLGRGFIVVSGFLKELSLVSLKNQQKSYAT